MSLEENNLELTPLKGKSGKAFIGTYPDGQRVFVKMNTTPILAALAKEQIAPQLLWAKRLANGGVMSAQEWLQGRLLSKEDMTSKQIVHILLRLHKSHQLVNQLLQLNYRIENPYDLLKEWESMASSTLKANSYIASILAELRYHLPPFEKEDATIIHGDIKHSNWIITTSGLIYLVDWDSVRLTDRMYDVAYLLSHYVPKSNWENWMSYYGYKQSKSEMAKLRWYGQLIYLFEISHYFNAEDMESVNKEIYALRKFREKF